MSKTGPVPEADKLDLAPWGYAPGNTLIYCTDCGSDDPSQCHKHSTRCATHAMEAYLKDLRSYEAEDFEPIVSCKSNILLRILLISTVIGGGIIGGMLTHF